MMTRVAFNADILPPQQEIAQAAARGVSTVVKRHFRDRDMSRPPNPFGLEHTGYWGLAADATRTEGNVITVHKEGVAIHLFGGVIRPKKRALAIPVDQSVADVNPREYDPEREHTFVTKAGAIGDSESGKILWILIPQAKIKPDRSVLPTDEELLTAAEDAAMDYLEAMS